VTPSSPSKALQACLYVQEAPRLLCTYCVGHICARLRAVKGPKRPLACLAPTRLIPA
jgi:hypothetical protein